MSKARIDDDCLQKRLQLLRTAMPDRDPLVRALETFIRTAPDDEVVRINPVAYAAKHGFDETAAIDLFLHARAAGLVVMEWHYVCRVCGTIVESFGALNAAGEHFFCKACVAKREADLSDYVEITFSISKAVRLSRFHDPGSLSVEEFFEYNISANAFTNDGTRLRDFYSQHRVYLSFVEPGETVTPSLDLEPGFLGVTPGPEIRVDSRSGNRLRKLEFTHRDGRPSEKPIVMAPGPFQYQLTNASSERIGALLLFFSEAELAARRKQLFGIHLGGFLSGSRLLSTQAFLDLFPSETVMSAGGLAVKRVALLFTDIKGSTALYSRIGDMKAYNLVRQHFGVLRDVIVAHHGALVKTIGDAVMASFHDPLNAIRAALDMLAQIRRFNDAAGEELITLKIGGHAGQCLAVTLNERLDYFGQTVNLAARVQGLAGANEFYLTDEMFRLAGAEDVLSPMHCKAETARVKGIDREIVVHAVSAGQN